MTALLRTADIESVLYYKTTLTLFGTTTNAQVKKFLKRTEKPKLPNPVWILPRS